MRGYLKRTPVLIQWLFPQIVWRLKRNDQICLTFDDGPNPISTPVLLNLLKNLRIQAVFFCLGERMRENPELVKQILSHGHQIGNHTQSHENGWHSSKSDYIRSVNACQEEIKRHSNLDYRYFRPPFGRMGYRQYRVLNRCFQLIMWSFMPGDFDFKNSKGRLQHDLCSLARGGDIIVLHDSPDSVEKLVTVLPAFYDSCTSKGLRFTTLGKS